MLYHFEIKYNVPIVFTKSPKRFHLFFFRIFVWNRKMALLKLFPIITDDSNKSFIPFDDFFRFLKRNDQKARRIDNVRQILKGYKDGIKTVGDQTCVPVISVIR